MVVNFVWHKLSPRGAATKISSTVRQIWWVFVRSDAGIFGGGGNWVAADLGFGRLIFPWPVGNGGWGWSDKNVLMSVFVDYERASDVNP